MAASLLVANAGAAPAGKQNICHLDATGGLFHVISVSQNAVAQHRAQHGDVLAGTFFADADHDGYGDAAGPTDACPNPGFVGNAGDAFPNDPSEHADADGDGVGDNHDAFPTDPSETTDSDGDGVGDNADAFPTDPSETKDSDGDGVGDNHDAFPADPSETTDSDGDGVGDNADGCPTQAGTGGNGCPPPVATLGSDLVIGKAGEFGHTGNVAMLFGDGAGGFTMDTIGINVFDQTHEVAVGDLNKDGKDDVVVVNSGGQVSVALGDFFDGLQNSDLVSAGAFTEGSGNCCNRTRVVQLDDVNNDGNLDIAVTMWSKMAVMLGNGNGTFGSAIYSSATGFDARGMALGDLDGDGKLDLVANHAPGSWWLAFHKGNGDGTFQAGIVINTPGYISDLAIPNIFLRDADGDGDLDIYTGALGARAKLFTNNGSAVFTKTDIESGAGFQGTLLVVDDLNGDGTPDIVASTDDMAAGIPTTSNNNRNIRAWLSNGSGGFNGANLGLVGSQPRQGVVADINQDGKKDLAMVTVNIFGGNPGSLWTLVGNGDGTFQAPTQPIATYRNNYTIAVGKFR